MAIIGSFRRWSFTINGRSCGGSSSIPTLGKYLAEGKSDYEALTDEDFENVANMEDALSEKAKFFIGVSRARGTCISQIAQRTS